MERDEELGEAEHPLLPESQSQSSRRRSGIFGSFHESLVEPLLNKFDVDSKNPTTEALSSWRKSSLVLNASRRFRYTSNLDKRPKERATQRLRVGSLAIKALGRFKSMRHSDSTLKAAKDSGFDISSRSLANMVEDSQISHLDHYGGAPGVANSLKSNLENGIEGSREDIAKRQKAYGTNTYPEKPQKNFFVFVWEAMQDLTLMILAICAVVSLVVGVVSEGWQEGWYDGAGIIFSVVIVVLVTAASDYQQSLQFKALSDEKKKVFVTVQRGGKRQRVSIFDLVVGDMIHLAIGDIIPADGIFVTGHSLVVDESSMTGESEPLHKDSTHPFLLSGTKVQDGSGVMLATGVGMNTEWGHLMATLSESGEDETPLQIRLSGVATMIGKLGLFVAVLVFVVLMIRFLVPKDYSVRWTSSDTLQIVNFFAVGVTIIVVAVPEGLPLAVTLTLAFAMKRMMKDKALVRKLAACETMGCATTICSDKTGTLTANQMTVVETCVGGVVRDPLDGLPDGKYKSILLESIFFNTSGDVDEQKDKDGHLNPVVLGSPTEIALLDLGLQEDGNFKAVRAEAVVAHVEPFNSKRKRMGIVVKLKDGSFRAHWKGAAEIILGLCDTLMDADGEVHPLKQQELLDVVETFATDALRTISLAYVDIPAVDVPPEGWPEDKPIPDGGLTLLTIVGIKDPLRPGVQHSVGLCKSAGIKVRMVTGDNLATAKAIAKDCGILTEGGEVIEGPQFRKLSPQDMRKLIPNLQVMARSSPSDKHTLVKELRAMGEVVAVTGDGTNDAPAIKEADIGLAMGIAGTEVAKESADIVVLDDNFATIVTVAKWGRSVYNNIQKFVQFQLTVNIVALTTNFFSACITGSAPLTAVQLLWVNLIMDTLGALALATDPPKDSLMLREPIGRKSSLVSPTMWRNILAMAIYQLAVLGVLQYKGQAILGYTGPTASARIVTLIFNSFVLCQVFNEFNSRDMEKINVFQGLFGNTMFIGVITMTVVFQFVLVQFLGTFASTVPLTLKEWAYCVLIGFVSMPVAAIVKFIPVEARKDRGASKATLPVENNSGYVEIPAEPEAEVRAEVEEETRPEAEPEAKLEAEPGALPGAEPGLLQESEADTTPETESEPELAVSTASHAEL